MNRVRNEEAAPLIRGRVPFTTHSANLRGVRGCPLELGRLPHHWAPIARRATYTVLSHHTPIAWFDDGLGWIVPDHRYSTTTTRYQNIVRRALRGIRMFTAVKGDH